MDIKILMMSAVATLCYATFGIAVDTDGNPVGPDTQMWDVDMKETTVGELRDVMTPGYDSVSNAAMNAATTAQLATKQDKLPYPTNAIPQGAVSGLSTALDGKVEKSDFNSATNDILSLVVPLQFAQYYPDGSVKSAAEFTQGIKYEVPDTVNRTIMVKPFCDTGDSDNDNSSLSGRVVIPPFVDAQGNGYKEKARQTYAGA